LTIKQNLKIENSALWEITQRTVVRQLGFHSKIEIACVSNLSWLNGQLASNRVETKQTIWPCHIIYSAIRKQNDGNSFSTPGSASSVPTDMAIAVG
jgi:hypothetical protein